MTIEVSGLYKRFGSTQALDGMTFTVPPGQITGFVGPNGAGKSTTIRVILGLDAPDQGEALIGGQRYQSLRRPLRHVGALVDAAALQPTRTARNHLLWLACSQKLTVERVDEVIELVGLASAARRKAGGFSLGMRQRLGIAAAMLGDPPVLILDEPFNGMDPEGIIWIRHFLRSMALEGRAILVSSHLMGELEDMADHVVIAGRGRVLADATVEELIARASGDQVLLRSPVPGEAAAALQQAGITASVTGRRTVALSGVPAHRAVGVLSQAGIVFSEITTARATLEDVYLQLTGSEAEYRATSGAGAER
jgi:ABC-2 type transport system ATP-binding protein